MKCIKRKFTASQAHKELEKMQKEHYRARNECRIYYCKACEAFHLTSQSIEEYKSKAPKLFNVRAPFFGSFRFILKKN